MLALVTNSKMLPVVANPNMLPAVTNPTMLPGGREGQRLEADCRHHAPGRDDLQDEGQGGGLRARRHGAGREVLQGKEESMAQKRAQCWLNIGIFLRTPLRFYIFF